MPFHQPDSIRYFTFESLSDAGIKHAIFTRRGGLSPQPWDSLNVGGLRGDDPERVYKNRVLSFNTLHRTPESVYDVWQVHSADVICTTGSRPPGVRHRKADSILTDNPEVTLFMRFADCVPIMLHDPVRKVVGLVHAGWMGTVKRIISATVETMETVYHTNPADVIAAIGPSISVHHYEVGREVAEQVESSFRNESMGMLVQEGDATYFDLWLANQRLLEQSGISEIESSGICTACNLQDWYSHRGERGNTGRFGALITLGD
jgi:YfiH family protein